MLAANMNIADIADYVWTNCLEYSFGGDSVWNGDLFLADWAKEKGIEAQWREMTEGWYWFCVKTSYQKLHGLKRPASLPANGCDFGLTTHENERTFGAELLCRSSNDGWLTVYNGHEKSVKSRVRSHFALNNDRTGALGLRHYPISAWQWKLRLFSVNQIDLTASPALRQRIELLIKSKSGRCSVESAWRVANGWPVLCKE